MKPLCLQWIGNRISIGTPRSREAYTKLPHFHCLKYSYPHGFPHAYKQQLYSQHH